MKKVLALLLAIAMIVGLTACGGSSLSKYVGVYTSSYPGLDFSIILDEAGSFGIYITDLINGGEGTARDFGLEDNAGLFLGTYKVGDEGKLYFSMNELDENADLGVSFVMLIIQGLFATPATYDYKAEVILINVEGEEVAFMKSNAKMPKLYTIEDIIAAVEGFEENNESKSERQEEPQPEKKPEKEESKLPAGVDDYMFEVDNYLGNAIENGWTDSWNYINKVADNGSNYYWTWAAGGGHGIVIQSISNPKLFFEDHSDTMGSVTSLIYAYHEATGKYLSFKSINYSYNTQLKYGDDIIDGEVWTLIDSNGNQTEYTFAIILPDWAVDMTDNPEELDWYTETTIFKDGNPWVGFDGMEGFPYKY